MNYESGITNQESGKSRFIDIIQKTLGGGVVFLLLLLTYFSRGLLPMDDGIKKFWLEEISNLAFYWILGTVIVNLFNLKRSQESHKSNEPNRSNGSNWIYILFLALALFSLRKLLFLPGVIGFRHDWSVPVYSLRDFYLSWRYLWQDGDLGVNLINQGYLTTWLHNFYLWLISLLGISGGVYSKLSIILAIALSGISAYHLCSCLIKKSPVTRYPLPVTLIPSLFYAFTPILFDKIVAGQTTYILAYSIAPWVLLFYFRSDEKKFELKNGLIAGLLLAIASVQIHFLVMISFLFILYLFFGRWRLNLLKTMATAWVVAALIHAPLLISLLSEFNLQELTGNLAVSEWLKTLSNPLSAIFNLASTPNPYFRLALGENRWWSSLSLFIPVLAFLALIFKPKEKMVVFTALAFLAAAFLSNGRINLENFPQISFFRELYHLFWIVAISYTILIFYSIEFFMTVILRPSPERNRGTRGEVIEKSSRLRSNNKYIFYLFCFSFYVLLFLYSYPFFTGDFGKQIQVYNPDPAYKILQEKLKNDPDNYYVLWLPTNQKNRPLDSGFGGTDALIKGSPKPALPQEGNILSAGDPRSRLRNQIVSKLYYGDDDGTLSDLLAATNVKYIIQRDDFDDQFPYYTLLKNYPELANQWTNENLKKNLENNPDIKLEEKIGPISLYENKNFRPRIYADYACRSVLARLPTRQDTESRSLCLDPDLRRDDIRRAIEPGAYATQYYDAREGWIRGWYWWWRDPNFASNPDQFIYTEKKGAEIVIPLSSRLALDKLGLRSNNNYKVFIKGYSLDRENHIDLETRLSDGQIGNWKLEIGNLSTDNWEWREIGKMNLSPVTRYSLFVTNKEGRNAIGQIAFVPEDQELTPHLRGIPASPAGRRSAAPDMPDGNRGGRATSEVVRHLDYQKINPAYYKIKINADKPFWLIFSEGYDPSWKLIGAGNQYPHQAVNGHANGFYIDKTGEYEIEMVYGKQKAYEIGLWISLMTVLGVIIRILMIDIRNWKLDLEDRS